MQDSVTDDFVECFGLPKNRNGIMWEMMKSGIELPLGVDAADPRVRRIFSDETAADELVPVR